MSLPVVPQEARRCINVIFDIPVATMNATKDLYRIEIRIRD